MEIQPVAHLYLQGLDEQVIASDCFQLGLDFFGMVRVHRLDLSLACVLEDDVIDALFAAPSQALS